MVVSNGPNTSLADRQGQLISVYARVQCQKQGSKRFDSQGRRNTLPIWVYNLSMTYGLAIMFSQSSGQVRFASSKESGKAKVSKKLIIINVKM